MFHYTKALLTVGPRILFSYFWIRKYAKRPEKYDLNKRYTKISSLTKKVLLALQSEITVVGQENIPNEPACFMSNHLGAFDPICYLSVMNAPTTFVAKVEAKKMPFIGKCIGALQGEFLDRKDLKQSLRVMMRVESDLKQKNKNWLIFPEGTRNKDTKANLQEFHHGTFRPAMRSEVPIVPCCVFGSWRVQKLKPQYKRYPIYVEFGKPIYPKDYKDMSTEEVAKLVQNEVQKLITYHARRNDIQEMYKYNKDKYLFNSND